MHIRHQFFQFFFRHDFAVEQVHFALGMFSKARIVRDHANRRAFTVQVLEQFHDSFAVAGIAIELECPFANTSTGPVGVGF
jgi:hypothetical protein